MNGGKYGTILSIIKRQWLLKLLYTIKPPCPKCPYTLGLVHTFVDPCPQCKSNDFAMYEQFTNKIWFD
jgi:predicted Zn-ribbon and HTH transcriptional regulator